MARLLEPNPHRAISCLERKRRASMRTQAFALGMAAAAFLAVGACSKQNDGAKGPPDAQTKKAEKVAGTKTIAAGLAPNSRFMAAAKAAGIDQTLAGPGPY